MLVAVAVVLGTVFGFGATLAPPLLLAVVVLSNRVVEFGKSPDIAIDELESVSEAKKPEVLADVVLLSAMVDEAEVVAEPVLVADIVDEVVLDATGVTSAAANATGVSDPALVPFAKP